MEGYSNGDAQEQQPMDQQYEQQDFSADVGVAGGDASGQEVSQSVETPGDRINASKNDDDDKKLFVGGISWETTVKELREYFQKFGEVVDATIKTDPTTGRSRGFGFVKFDDVASVEQVLAEKNHVLRGKAIDPKRAKARGGREPVKKVFVGGLDPNIPEDDVREFFGKLGKIEEMDLPYDKQKGQRRAFCFITYESEDAADKACGETGKQTINGKEVDVKKATPKNEGRYQSGGGYNRGPGGYGSYGGYNQSYSQGYGGYDQSYGYGYGQGYGYDQSYGGGYNYPGYGQQGYSGYDQSYNYGSGYSGGYGGGEQNSYDYNQSGGWGSGYGNQGSGGGQQDGGYKQKRGGTSNRGGGYHPYSR